MLTTSITWKVLCTLVSRFKLTLEPRAVGAESMVQ